MYKTWFIASRPWAFPAAIIPVCYGTALAWQVGCFHLPLFFITLAAAILIQAGTNYINTWGDYISGVDTIASATTCPQLVTGQLTARQVRRAGLLCFALSTAAGLWLVWQSGWPVLLCAVIGLCSGYTYTAGPYPYKYHGLGGLFVFILMGPLMVWPTWYIQTRSIDLLPMLLSLPLACLVSAILQANDLRDIDADAASGINTLPLIIGRQRAVSVYRLSIAAAFISVIVFCATGLLPTAILLTMLLLPPVLLADRSLRKRTIVSRYKLEQLVPETAALQTIFGILLTLGLIIAKIH